MKIWSERGMDKAGIKLLGTVNLVADSIIEAIGKPALGAITAGHYLTAYESAFNKDYVAAYFSPNPPKQYGWSRIGQVCSVEPQAHRQRVNVLGTLRQDGKLIWCTQQRPKVRTDVIAFFDRLSETPHSSPRIVVIDNAAIHKGEAMDSKHRQ